MSSRGPMSCPSCCGSAFGAAFRQHERDFERCAGCGFVRMQTPPDDAALLHFYKDDRSHGEQVFQEHEKFLVLFHAILERIERHAGPGRFLDVGCSYGNAMVAARERGWEVVGIELSRPAAEGGMQRFDLDIRMVPLAEAGLEPGSFDAVLMHHTLEHLSDPEVAVGHVHRLLRPGGVHFQALPNYDSLKRRLLGSFWGYGVTLDHLVHFGPRTLRRMLERIGFDILEQTTPSASDDPRLLWDILRRFGRERRFMTRHGRADGEFDAATYIGYMHAHRWAHWLCTKAWPAGLVSGLGLGEEIYMLARKPAAD